MTVSHTSLRRLIIWISTGCAGLALVLVIAVLLGIRFAPQRIIPHLPLVALSQAQMVANYQGKRLIAQRLREPAAQEIVVEFLQGSVGRQLRMLDMLGANLGGYEVWSEMPKVVKDLIQPLCTHPDEHMRMAARKLFSSVELALEWNKRELLSGREIIIDVPPGPGSWIPDRIGSVGLELLSYLSAGYDHKTPNTYKKTVTVLIDTLLAAQSADGRMGTDARDHAIATLALAEAYAMTNDPRLKLPAQLGEDWIIRASDAGPEARWSANSDLSIWDMMAIKSGAAGGLSVTMKRMNLWRQSDPDFGLRWRDNGVEVQVHAKDLLAQRALIGVYCGDTTAALKIPAEDLIPDTTLSECSNYWLSLALFELGNINRFSALSDLHHRRIINDQWWNDGSDNGRLLASGGTAAHCLRLLTLEIFLRHARISL